MLPSWTGIAIHLSSSCWGQQDLEKFVECIANDHALGIAKDQLDGVTQILSVYRVQNVFVGDEDSALFLVDTPGFADSKIPESKTMRLVMELARERDIFFNHILYFDRITDSRMAGSKRKLLDLFREMTGTKTGQCVTFVTTMWDGLWNEEQIMKANKRFEEMRDVYYKEFVQDKALLVKFENNYESAIAILDRQRFDGDDNVEPFMFEKAAEGSQEMSGMSFSRALHRNLLERKAGLLQSLRMIESELTHELADPIPDLRYTLLKQMEEKRTDLAVVEEELEEFPPLADEARNDIVDSQAMTSPTSDKQQTAFQRLRSSSAPPQPGQFKAALHRGRDRLRSLFTGRHK
ncbi:hypothetical protein BJ165DRAFT_1517330 [Panaeolus papilionaceus]|nr:hypothetical protein BJ165DRAFT_1517330 [Panaeolus papilionaceus]